MIIKIGSKTKEFMRVLNIDSYPFTSLELSIRRRELMKDLHPDTNTDSSSVEKSALVNEAFNHLINLAIDEVTEEKSAVIKGIYEEEKDDMFSYWETCTKCKGTGNIVIKTPKPKGNHYDFKIFKCDSCFGVGKIKKELFNPVIRKGAILK